MRLDEYMRELNKVALLTPEEESSLWKAFKENGSMEARRKLIESYQPLVFKNAWPFRQLDNIMDVIQEGTVGLIEAVESYEPERKVAFSLFAVHRIRGRILTFLKKEGKSELACIDGFMGSGDELSPKELLVDPAMPVAEQVETHELVGQLRSAMERLPDKERRVLERVYLHSEEVREVAEGMQVSPSHIYRLQKNGIRRVRGMLSRFMQYW